MHKIDGEKVCFFLYGQTLSFRIEDLHISLY